MSKEPQSITRKTPMIFYIGTSMAAIIIAMPLLSHQFPHPRPGLFWYPIFFIVLQFLIGWGLTRVSALGSSSDLESEAYQKILAIVACFTAGFFTPWFATIGPEVLGNNAWAGNVLYINLLSAIVGLLSGFWSAFAIRLLRSLPNTGRSILVIAGCIAIQLLWIFAERVNDIPAFWTILESLSQRYAAYFLFEALAGQVVWPLALVTCLYVYLRGNKGFTNSSA